MNYRIVRWMVVLPLLLAGCDVRSDSADPATPTLNVVPPLDPSPTPNRSVLPLTCQITVLNIFIDESEGYCFAYPTRFTVGIQPMLDIPAIVGPAVGNSVDPVFASFAVEVTIAFDGDLRTQAKAFLREFSATDPAAFNWSQIQVGGEAGLMVESVPVMLSWRIVFVQHNGNLFRLMYWPVDVPGAQPDLDELTRTTLGSFAFTK